MEGWHGKKWLHKHALVNFSRLEAVSHQSVSFAWVLNVAAKPNSGTTACRLASW